MQRFLPPLALGAALAAAVVAPRSPAADARTAPAPESRVVTLYANDDLLSSIDFRTGGPGARLADGEIDLRGAQLVYHALRANHLSFGFVYDELAEVVDLGELFVTPDARVLDDAAKFPISVFHTLFLDGGRVAYRDARGRTVRLPEGLRILGPLVTDGTRHVEPRVGHVYLLRTRDRSAAAGKDRLVKLEVVDHEPGRTLTLRWAPLGEL